MPYCEECDRFLNPSSLTTEGECPSCRRTVADTGAAQAPPKAPWHFKLLVAGVCGYLGWRAVQLLDWLL